MKLYSNLSILLSALLFGLLNISNRYEIKELQEDQPKKISLTISAVGDIMCHSSQYEYAKVAADSFDFTPPFSEVKKYFDSSDIVFGNFESVTAGKAKLYSGYPFFNSPDSYVASLKKIGFDFLFTANNHCLDRGEEGVMRTLEKLKCNQINSTGTFSSQEERDSISIISVKGFQIAVIAYTYGTNGNFLPRNKSYLVNTISDTSIIRDIQNAKLHGVDLILVYYHFGEEYQREPNQYQRNAVQTAIDAGADVILASHPHVLQPVQMYKSNGKLDSGFVAYSLGNFFSNQRWRYSDAGAILQFQMTKDISSKEVRLDKVSFIPTWVFKGKIGDKKQFVILPSSKNSEEYPFLSKYEYQKMVQSFNDSKQIIQKYSSFVQLNLD